MKFGKTNLGMILVLVIGLFAFEGFAQSAQRIQAVRMVQQGDNNLQLGLLNDAIFSYTNAITTDPTYVEAYVKRANMYQRVGRYTEAKRDLEKAQQMNPYSAYVMDGSAKLNFIAADDAKGLEEIEKAVKLDPDNPTFIDHRVDGYILTGEYEKAKDDIGALLKKAYHVEYTNLKQGLVQFLENDLKAAEVTMQSVLDLNPNNAMAYDVLGLVYLKRAAYDSALTEFDKALEINPEFSLALYNKGVVYKLLDEDDTALEYFDKAIQTQLTISKTYFERGVVKSDMGKYEGSIEDYSEVDEVDSIYFNAIYNRAFSFKMLGDFPSALVDADKAVELRPRDASALAMRGNIHLLFGDYDEAISDYDEALQWRDDMLEIRFNKGLALLFDHQIKAGCAELKRAVDEGYTRGDEAYRNFCAP